MAAAGRVRLCLGEPCSGHVNVSVADLCRTLVTGEPVVIAEHVVEDHPVYRGERVETLLGWDGEKLLVYWVGEDRGYIEGYEVPNAKRVLKELKDACGR